MIKQLLEEVKAAPLELDVSRTRNRLREIYDSGRSTQLSDALSPDLQPGAAFSLAMPFSDDEVPSEGELRIAQAQLVGWLEGLFHGIQATLFAQQLAARQQLEGMRGRLGRARPRVPPRTRAVGPAPTSDAVAQGVRRRGSPVTDRRTRC